MQLNEIKGYSRFLKLGKIEMEEKEEVFNEQENSFKRIEEDGAVIILLIDQDIIEDLDDGTLSSKEMNNPSTNRDFFNAFLYVEEKEKLISYSLDSYFISDAPIYLDIVDKEGFEHHYTLEGEPVLAKEEHYFNNDSDYEAMLDSVPLFLRKYNLPTNAKVNIVHVS